MCPSKWADQPSIVRNTLAVPTVVRSEIARSLGETFYWFLWETTIKMLLKWLLILAFILGLMEDDAALIIVASLQC